jgi:hypothetical protein
MTPDAVARASTAAGLRMLADAIDADEAVPLPASCWPLTFHAEGRDDLEAIARSLAVADTSVTECIEEDCWVRLDGRIGGLRIRITADAGPVLLDPLTDEGAIVRTCAGVTS